MKLTSEQKKEIQEQQSQSNSTKRVTSPELEKVLYEAIPVLDHGFIRVIDYMGDDSSIVQSARVSYGKGTKKVSTDEGLIKYLMRHRHSTPFEMCEIKYHGTRRGLKGKRMQSIFCMCTYKNHVSH